MKYKLIFQFRGKSSKAKNFEYNKLSLLTYEELKHFIPKYTIEHWNRHCDHVLSLESQFLLYFFNKNELNLFQFKKDLKNEIYNLIDGELEDIRTTLLQAPESLYKLFSTNKLPENWYLENFSIYEYIPEKYAFLLNNKMKSQEFNFQEWKTLKDFIELYFTQTQDKVYAIEKLIDIVDSEFSIEDILSVDQSYYLGSAMFGKGKNRNLINPLLINHVYNNPNENLIGLEAES